MNKQQVRYTGRFTKVFWPPHDPRGFAFLRNVKTGKDLFCHKNDVILAPGDTLPGPGDYCTFEIGRHDDRDVAILVKKVVLS